MSSTVPLAPINDGDSNLLSRSQMKLSALPGTDLWRKPPSLDISNANHHVLDIPVASFRRARVTVSAPWRRQYDQGGLVLFLPAWPARTAWIKAGIEYYMGKASVSVVAARAAADWSLSTGAERVTLEMERETANDRTSLWVYAVDDGGVRSAVREVTWVFADEKEVSGLMSVGIYAARPTKQGDEDSEELTVTFDDLELDFDQG